MVLMGWRQTRATSAASASLGRPRRGDITTATSTVLSAVATAFHFNFTASAAVAGTIVHAAAAAIMNGVSLVTAAVAFNRAVTARGGAAANRVASSQWPHFAITMT